jgi:hypothetical protein
MMTWHSRPHITLQAASWHDLELHAAVENHRPRRRWALAAQPLAIRHGGKLSGGSSRSHCLARFQLLPPTGL